MKKTIYKGVEIRVYGEKEGESVYPLAFTDNLDKRDSFRRAIVHDDITSAKTYIDQYL